MYARIQTIAQLPDTQARDVDQLVDTISGHPGFAGLYALAAADGTGRSLVTLWDTEDDARHAADRTEDKLGPRPVELTTDLLYEVRDDFAGVSADQTPRAAGMIWFSGPMSEEQAAIGRQLRRRVAPTVLAVPGFVRMLALFQPDTKEPCMLNLLTSADIAPAVQQVFAAAELKPEEQWAATPNRVELYSVEATAGAKPTNSGAFIVH